MKKFLAVALSAAMVLGMSTMAFAEGPTVSYSAEGLTLYVDVAGDCSAFQGTVDIPEGATVAKSGTCKEFKAAADEQELLGFPAANVADGQFIYAAAYTSMDGSPFNYEGHAFFVTFESDTTVTLPDGTVKELTSATPAPVETEAPAPVETEAPAPAPVETKAPAADETKAPAADATKAPAGTGATTAPAKTTTTTSTTTNKTTAAKTADVAPVATMAVLALAAGVVVVSMKKKVTE